MRVVFESVSERDVDLLLMDQFASNPSFARFFMDKIKIEGYWVEELYHSLTDVSLGESDITVVFANEKNRHGLLIENKIDALAQPEQYTRYLKRGRKQVEAGLFGDFSISLVAPRDYLDSNGEAKKYPCHIAYEELLSMLEADQGADHTLACVLLSYAIKKKQSGYQVIENTAVTEFWRKYEIYQQLHFPQLKLRMTSGSKGSRALWPVFSTRMKGVSINHKSTHRCVDLELGGLGEKSRQIKAFASALLQKKMYWVRTGKSLSVRVEVPPMDFTQPFEGYEREMQEVLTAVQRLDKLSENLFMIAGYDLREYLTEQEDDKQPMKKPQEKAALRRSIRQRAQELNTAYLRASDQAIMERLLALDGWISASKIFIYLSMGTEPDTAQIVQAAWDSGKRVAIPRCLGNGVMEAREITSFECLTPKSLGILEPDGSFPLIAPEELDLVVAPCVAVDKKLNRLGNGGGFYDRYLAGVRCPVICLCRDVFVLDQVPREALDQPMGMVVTEERIYGP